MKIGSSDVFYPDAQFHVSILSSSCENTSSKLKQLCEETNAKGDEDKIISTFLSSFCLKIGDKEIQINF